MKRKYFRRRNNFRALRLEGLEQRMLMASDLDDSLAEATNKGQISTTAVTIDASIALDTDVDMYRFSVAAGQVVDFDIDTALNGPGGLGSYLRLFNGQGLQLAANNDAAAPGENVVGYDAYLRYSFATAGSYYLGVSNVNNATYNPLTGDGDVAGGLNVTGDYRLIMQGLPVDPDDSLSEATFAGAISTTAITINASVTPDIDVDMYRFTVVAGQMVDIDIDTALNGPGGLGSYLRLYSAQGQQLAANNDAAAPGENVVGFDAYLRYSFATAGSYYVGVSNANNTSYDPLTGNGDAAGGRYSVGDYQLILQTVPVAVPDTDDSLAEATALGAASTTSKVTDASITLDVDVDMYRFTVTAGQVVDFDIDTTLNGPGGLGSYLRLFNAQGLQLAANNDAAAPGENVVGYDAYLRYSFATAGSYYIGVSNVNNASYNALTGAGDVAGGLHVTGDYRLIVQALPVDPDDSLSEATFVGTISTTAKIVTASVTPDIDVDMYRFTVAAGQTVDIDIDTTLNGPGGLGSYLRLFNAQGLQLDANNDAAAPGENVVGFDAYLRYFFPTAGSYYVGVSNANNAAYNPLTGTGDAAGGKYSVGDYQLILQTAPVTVLDTDDSLAEASSLGAVSTTGKVTDANISLDVDVDMYRFTVTAGQVVDFDIDTTLNGLGGLGSYLRLYNAQGQQLDANNDAAAPGENVVGFDAYLRYTFATAGTYYVGVSNANNTSYNPLTGDGDAAGGLNATGTYRLIVQALPVDTDDSLAEAPLVGQISATAATISSSISTDIDVNMYRFTVAAGQVVDFDIDTTANGPGGLGSYLRLFNAQGLQLAANNDAAAPGEGVVGFDAYLRYSFATAGTYYVGVSNANNTSYNPVTGNGDVAGGLYTIGSYQLILQTAPSAIVPTLSLVTNVSSIPELNGVATGMVTRGNANISQPLTITLSSSDTGAATVPPTVVIAANQLSAAFAITAVHSTTRGTTSVTITAVATGYAAVTQSLLVTDSDAIWHNPSNPYDVDNDGTVSPLDALLIVGYVNANGSGPVPAGNAYLYLDVNGDNVISPLDALLVINALNGQGNGEGESSNPSVRAKVTTSSVDALFAAYSRTPFALLNEYNVANCKSAA